MATGIIRRDGMIPEWQRGVTVERHIVFMNKKSLIVTIHNTVSSTTIYIGNDKTYCIDAMIMKPSSGADIRIGILEKIRYDEECVLGENRFERGRDTTALLKLLLSYIHDNYPHVTHLLFNDMSMRVCDDGNEVSLALMSYLATGKTWYETHFGAFRDTVAEQTFRQREGLFQEAKTRVSWEAMSGFINAPLPIPEEEMRILYNAAATWQEFFGPLRARIGIQQFCIFLAPWIRNFAMCYLRDTFTSPQFLLPVGNYGIHYKTRGGKRHRRTKRGKRNGRHRKTWRH
jgi:hypothetical protein